MLQPQRRLLLTLNRFNPMVSFAQPWALLLLAVPLWLAYRWWKRGRPAPLSFLMPELRALSAGNSWRASVIGGLSVLPIIALGLLAVALARPQRHWQEQKVKADAVDIVLAIDVSPSMLSRDFEPDRLSVALEVAQRFVRKRATDRLGVVLFSAEAFTLCPLTTDRDLVQELLKQVQVGRLEDGTAIGMGLATAVNRLKDSPSKSKVIVLLTDGENNAGYITPLMAAEMAQLFGIRVYAIGIGTTGIVLSPVVRNPDGTYQYAPRQTSFDTELLEEIAAMTKGKFYRAWTEKELTDIYDEIDRLEKTRVEVTVVRRTAEYFPILLLVVLAILGLEIVARWAGLRSLTQ